MITKGERSELQRLIRQRFNVLRAEVEQRAAELRAELEERITEHFRADDKAWSDVMFLIGEATREANRTANDAVRALVGADGWPEERVIVRSAEMMSLRAAVATAEPTKDAKSQLRRSGQATIEATVKGVKLRLDRQEADVLTRLLTETLESEEARAFLGAIPTVSELVPSALLLELEQSLK